MQYFFVGLPLIIWIAILAAIMLRKDNRLSKYATNNQILLPVGVLLAVWGWIVAVVVSSI